MVLSIEAKKMPDGKWHAFTDNGRERSGRDVHEWVQQAVGLGAGEVLLTSIDQEGTRKGFDLELTRSVSEIVPVPVIASGGMGSVQDLFAVVDQGKADAVAMADILHYDRMTLVEIRDAALAEKIHVRQV